MTDYSQSLKTENDILVKSKIIEQGKNITEAGIDAKWAGVYGTIARRCRYEKDFGIRTIST